MTVGHSRFHIHEHGSLFGRPLGRSEVIQSLRLQVLESLRVQNSLEIRSTPKESVREESLAMWTPSSGCLVMIEFPMLY